MKKAMEEVLEVSVRVSVLVEQRFRAERHLLLEAMHLLLVASCFR